MGAEQLERDPTAEPVARPGDRIGRYRILAELGRGGMGVVFRATDLDLNREVALKCPWPHLASNPEHRRRFLHEARATSLLSHPNIVQVFEAFEADGYPWMALQYVPGRDLHSLLTEKGRLPIDTVLRYGEDLASALKAAHDHDVLHRDIKPRNVLITPDDRALLGDFGLARILPPVDADSQATTVSASLTPAGSVPGTPRYMSPEQALGRAVDKRSDIFSLGSVLYEMCAGVPAFSGSEHRSLFDAIIHGQPEPLSRFTYEVPEELERIIRKAMAKLPGERFQDCGELLVDLRALRRQRDFEEYSASHPKATERRPLPLRKHLLWLIPAALVLIWLAWRVLPRARESNLPRGQPVQVTAVDGWEGQPALSPDGGRVAYASDAGGNIDLYVVDVHGGSPLRLTDDAAIDAYPVWFPSGSALAFVSDRNGESSIWKTGQLGGGATLLIPNAVQPAISPDGSRIAFSRATAGGNGRIGVASLANPAQVAILTDDRGGVWSHEHPAWSPDGKWICYATRHGLWMVPSAGGAPRRLTKEPELDRDPAWSPSGEHIYFSSYREGTVALWRIGVQGGTPERVTIGTGHECRPAISRDGSRLVYATQVTTRNLVLLDLDTHEETVLHSPPEIQQAAFSADGRLLVVAAPRSGGEYVLWLQPLADDHPAGPPRQLTDEPGDASHPVLSPDGRWIAYYRIIGEERDIWVMPTQGGQPVQFTTEPAADIHPAWSPDGTELAFASERSGGSHVWIAPVVEGRPAGPARQVEHEGVSACAPVWSPDGTEIAFVGTDERSNDVWVVAAGGDAPARRLTTGANVTRVRWDRSRGDLLVCGTWGGDRFSLRRVPLEGGTATPLDSPVDLGAENSAALFDLSADGRKVAFTHADTKGDIWLLEARGGKY